MGAEPHCRYCGALELDPRCPLRGVREEACRLVTLMTSDEYQRWKAEQKVDRRT